MKKSSVDLKTGWITISTRKTGKKVEIPMMFGLRKHFEEKMFGNDSEFVFPELADMYGSESTRPSIGVKIKSFLKEIGITGARKSVDGYQKKVSAKDIHSFRHTFCYLAAVNGIPFPIVQNIVGHSSSSMTRHYMDHADREKKAEYLMRLPNYILGETKTPTGKTLSRERVAQFVRKLNPDNIERIKERLLRILG